MSFSLELALSISVQILTAGIFIGIYKCTIDFMQKQIFELKDDMKKYNNVLARLAVNENSTASAHHRVDTLEDRITQITGGQL